MRSALMLAMLPALIGSAVRPLAAQSFTYCHSGGPIRNFGIVSYDADFLFAARHYGDHRDFAGNSEPGFFVHSRAHDRWIRIRTVSTTDARFGRSSSPDSAASRRFLMVSVSWDFTALAAQPYAALPLVTSGSIALPDSVVYEESAERYALHFMSSWRDIPTATSTMYIRRSDLVAAFADRDPWANSCL